MECNKDEAIRAKEIAVNKMQNDDFQGALKLANKAKNLFAEVDNISQILAVCNIHIAAGDKIGDSELDLYKILQLEKSADEATIRKQYKLLAYAVHPDRNRFPGAEAAFKLVREANVVLSDQHARSLYDSRCRELERKIGVLKPKGDVKPNAFGSKQGDDSPFHINTQNQRRNSFSNSNNVPWGRQNMYHGDRSSKAKEKQEEMEDYFLSREICEEAPTRIMSSGLQTENRQHISAGRTQPSSKPNHHYQQQQPRHPYAGVHKPNYAKASSSESKSSINANIALPPPHSDIGAQKTNVNVSGLNANPHRQSQEPQPQQSSTGAQITNTTVPNSGLGEQNHHPYVEPDIAQESLMCFPFAQTVYRLFQRKKKDEV